MELTAKLQSYLDREVHLTAEETELYEELKSRSLRLEQERISHAWAAAQIRNLLS